MATAEGSSAEQNRTTGNQSGHTYQKSTMRMAMAAKLVKDLKAVNE